jgi:hypothetical protein
MIKLNATRKFTILVPTQVEGEILYRLLDEGQGVFETEELAVAYMATEAAKRERVSRWFIVVPQYRLTDE